MYIQNNPTDLEFKRWSESNILHIKNFKGKMECKYIET